MPRQYERLEGLDLWELEPGMHCDGAGLYLRVDWDGGRRWSFIYHRPRRREMSLGPLRDVPLEEARAEACRARCRVRAGGDPIGERCAERSGHRTHDNGPCALPRTPADVGNESVRGSAADIFYIAGLEPLSIAVHADVRSGTCQPTQTPSDRRNANVQELGAGDLPHNLVHRSGRSSRRLRTSAPSGSGALSRACSAAPQEPHHEA